MVFRPSDNENDDPDPSPGDDIVIMHDLSVDVLMNPITSNQEGTDCHLCIICRATPPEGKI